MPHHETSLNYATTPQVRQPWTWKQWLAAAAAGLCAIVLLRILLFGFITSAWVRLDCGDICYTFYGIPVQYRRMPEPQRTALLAIAATSTKTPAKWEWIEFGGRHNPDSMCQSSYSDAALWAPVDPNICRFALEDAADFVQTQHWQSGLPDSTLATFLIDRSTGLPKPNWKEDQGIRAYCPQHGYILP